MYTPFFLQVDFCARKPIGCPGGRPITCACGNNYRQGGRQLFQHIGPTSGNMPSAEAGNDQPS